MLLGNSRCRKVLRNITPFASAPPQGNALSFRRKAAEYVLPVITIAAVLMVKHLSCVPQGRELPGVQGEFASFAESQGLGEYVGRLKKR